jgi:hypothetical protein
MLNTFSYPRPEYPRPDRQRGALEGIDWLNLNGPWQFRFDRHKHGAEEGWHLPDAVEWREQIIVPFCWESLAAWGEGDAAGNDNYYATRVFLNPLNVTRSNHRSAPRYEVGWYRRQVEIPNLPAWKGKRIILTIGAADFFTDAWCNGKHLGRHEGGYTPFEFDLTDALTQTDDGRLTGLLVLRVEDPMDNHEQPAGKQWRWYTTISGIWQTVFIEPRHASHIDCFRSYSDIDAGTVRLAVNCIEAGDDCVVRAEITPPGGAAQSASLPIKNGLADATIKLKELFLWNPNEPHLYDLKLELQRGKEVLDSVRSYFGVRKIDFAPNEAPNLSSSLRLNGVARYLRGALHQSYYPDGVYTATDVEVLKNDIECAKKFGFNFLRIHIKVDDPLLLYYADKMGMLLMADFPNFGEGGDTPLGRGRFETMMREAIRRDFNHPAIFAWCMFNETWGFGGQSQFVDLIHPVNPKDRPRAAVSAEGGGTAELEREAAIKAKPRMANIAAHSWVQSMWELAKQLDPTRLIEDMSVCHWDHLEYYQHGDTDINSWHFYISDYWKAKKHIQKVVESTFPGSSFNYIPGYQHKGQPLINSEYGGVGALDGDRDVSWSFKFLTNELRRHPEISAYIYTELHDVEWEHNGFLNYDRTPKRFGYNPAVINESDTLPLDAPPICHVAPGEVVRVPVASSHFSSRQKRQITLQWRLGGIDIFGRYQQDLARGAVPIEFPHRKVVPAHTIELKMPASPMRCSLSVDAVDAQGATVAQNFLHFHVSTGYPPNREETARALILRAAPGNWRAAEWSLGSGDREQARADDYCYGVGHGHFEWEFPMGNFKLSNARRIRILCEASSHRIDTPQTDYEIYPTTFRMLLNQVRVYEAVLRNHPHDSRGMLSYLRGGRGAYGYLAHALAEDDLLASIVQNSANGSLLLRCGVPGEALAQGGLSIYGAECGRFPVCPTIIIEW